MGMGMIDGFSTHQAGRGFSPRTILRRQHTLVQLERHVSPSTLADATAEDVEQFLAAKAAPRTRHAYRSDLRCFYRWALRRQLVDHDPTVYIDSIKVPKSLPRPLSGDPAVTLMQVGTVRSRRMTALGLFAGLRCAEIAGLDASDVLTHTEPKVIVVRNGKGAKDRVVPMHPTLVELFDDLASCGPLFANRHGVAVQPASVGETIKRHLAAAGVDGVPHQLRHTFGTALARRAGGNLLLVGYVMGHESLKTTQGYTAFDGGAATALIPDLYGGDAA